MIIDLHNHILPGVDDGAMSMEDAVEMAALAARCGIRKIVATPHYQYGSSASIEALEDTFATLSSALEYEQIDITLEKSMVRFLQRAVTSLPKTLSFCARKI